MSGDDTEAPGGLDQIHELSAPPEKVWRALSIPAFRDRWLPPDDLVTAEPTSSTPGREITFRMRDADPPFVESTVTFRIGPSDTGGTWLRIIHAPTDARWMRATTAAANGNTPPLLRAA